MVLTKEMMTEQMKGWRMLAKSGILKIMHYNNKTHRDTNEKTWHCLVVREYDPETNQICNGYEPDPFPLFIFNHMVSGCLVYAFKTEANRDAVCGYVMKNIQ